MWCLLLQYNCDIGAKETALHLPSRPSRVDADEGGPRALGLRSVLPLRQRSGATEEEHEKEGECSTGFDVR